MSLSQTSIESYRELTPEQLGDRQRRVYELLRMAQPMCNREIAAALGWPINCVTPRVNELCRGGLLESAGLALDLQTRRRVHRWQVAR